MSVTLPRLRRWAIPSPISPSSSLFVAVTMVVVIRASRNNASAADFFTGGRGFSGPQNGIAIAGDYLSAASFLGIAGAIAVYGYDGFLYSIGFLVAWLVALLLVAELLRNTGKFTMADVLSFRLKAAPGAHRGRADHPDRLAVLPARADGGRRWPGRAAARHRQPRGQSIVIAVVGVLMIVYVLVGGMKGTTWVQIIKAVLLIAGRRADDRDGAGASSASTSPTSSAAAQAIGVGSTNEAVAAPRRARARRAVRRQRDVQAQLPVARPRPGARHRGSAARADALLHGAHRQGGSALGGVGDRR